MNASELRNQSIEDLRELSKESRKELFELRFKHYTGQLTDSASLKTARRNIARIETVIREREIAQTAAE